MSRKKVVVIGSSNTDMVVRAARIPSPGETILGGDFLVAAGGKGANQAVAAARLGADVVFVACVGNDSLGKQAIENFSKEQINTDFVRQDETLPSGVALITVDSKGENCIVVAPGANAALSQKDILSARAEIEKAGVVLLQLENPVETVHFAAKTAAENRTKVILNPAPAQKLSPELLRYVSIITPNETEAQLLTGVEVTDRLSAERAAEVLHNQGVNTVVITMGAQGAYVSAPEFTDMVTPPIVKVVDTTAAGDVFSGALARSMAHGHSLSEAVAFACRAASLSVTRAGAQPSIPKLTELE